jgi:hypothetical protein
MTAGQQENAVQLNDLTFSYPGCEPFISNCSIDLPKGSRCLLIGANGAGEPRARLDRRFVPGTDACASAAPFTSPAGSPAAHPSILRARPQARPPCCS